MLNCEIGLNTGEVRAYQIPEAEMLSGLIKDLINSDTVELTHINPGDSQVYLTVIVSSCVLWMNFGPMGTYAPEASDDSTNHP